jgi:two-component system, chemotaxis family, chemotaxis protein CheY
MGVLVVDDQTAMVRIIQNPLRQLGVIPVDAAPDGFVAFDELRTERYDLVITENVIATKKADVSNYIVKPFNAETLNNKIELIFAARCAAVPERPRATGRMVPIHV